jgi:hypothetical protein
VSNTTTVDIIPEELSAQVVNGTILGTLEIGILPSKSIQEISLVNDYNGAIGLTLNVSTGIYEIVVLNASILPAKEIVAEAHILDSYDDEDFSLKVLLPTEYIAPNNAPDAVNDTLAIGYESEVNINVLNNDTDIDGDKISVTAVSVSPSEGIATINADGTIKFIAAVGFVGVANITYTISDGKGGADSASVAVTVTPLTINIAPDAIIDEKLSTTEDTAIIIDVLHNDIDANGDILTIVSATVVESQGKVEIVDNKLLFTPKNNYNGEAEITYTISDGVLTDTTTATVTVSAVNDAPIATNDVATTKENEAVTIDVLANDMDVDGDILTITKANSTDGTAVIVDGKIVFTPSENFVGTANITYTISDRTTGGLTSLAIASVNVVSSNHAPTDLLVAGASVSEHAAAGTVVATMSVVDADMPNDSFTFALDGKDAGLFAIDKNGTITVLKSDSLALGCIDGGEDSSRVVNVTVTDAAGESYSEAVTITVKNIIEAPVVYSNPCSCSALTIHGADGNDLITTGYGNDTVISCAGDDIIKTGYGNDTIYAGAGNDTIYAGTTGCGGVDTVDAGKGNDKIVLDSTSIKLNGNDGFDTITFGAITVLDMTSNTCNTKIPDITNIEAVDMRDTTTYSHCGTSYGTADKLVLNASAVDKMTTNDVLYIQGNTSDTVSLEGGKYVTSNSSSYCCHTNCKTTTFDSDWDKASTSTVNGIYYTSYISNNETVWVQTGVQVTFAI